MNLDRRLLRLARKSPVVLALTIGLGLAAGVFAVAQAGLFSRIVDRVYLQGKMLPDVALWLAALAGVIALRALLTWGSELAGHAIAMRVKTDSRSAVFQHLLDLGPYHSHGERTGELSSVALEGIDALDAYFSQYLPGLALAALVPLTYLLIVIPLDPLSGLVLLLTAPLIPLFMILIGNAAQSLTKRQWQTLSRLSAYFLDVLQGLTTLKMLGRSRAQTKVIAEASDQYRQRTMNVLRVTFLSALVLEMVATLSTAVVAVEVGLRLLYGRLSFEQALFVLLLAPEFYLPLRQLGTRFHAGMSGVAAAQRIFAILETPVLHTSPPPEPGINSTPLPGSPFSPPAIDFENVSFSYAGQGAQSASLVGVTYRLAPGQKIALVGPSGGGKSTVAALLLGFIQPEAGRIIVDGQPLGDLDPAIWRSQVSWVSQTPYLFNDTVLANICLGRPDATPEQVELAARQAEAHEFISALPQGYATLIGERGVRLSAGQAQRIALARAFLLDAPLVILDEATVNLDPRSEALIQASLERLLQGRTALIIAHRLTTTRSADQILVMERGQIVERGTHAELFQREGLYWRLAQAFGDAAAPTGRAKPSPQAPNVQAPMQIAAQAGFETLLPASQGGAPQTSMAVPALPASELSPRLLGRLLGFLTPFKGLVALSALAGAATVLSAVGLMATSAYIISTAALHPSIAELQVAIVGVRFFGISRGLFRYLERYLSHQVTFRLLANLRVWFYQALEPLAPARLMMFRSGDLLARILGDIESLESFYVRVAAPPFTAILVALAVYGLLSSFAGGAALAWLFVWLVAALGIPSLARWMSRQPGRQVVALRAELQAALVDGIQGMADLIAYGRGAARAAQVDRLSRALAGQQRRMAAIGSLQSALVGLLANLSLCLMLALTIPLVSEGRLPGVYLAVLALIALTSFEAVTPLPLAAQYLESNLQAARRLFDLVDAPPALLDPGEPLPPPPAVTLEIKNLCFRYETDEPGSATLDTISLRLPAGGRKAIVGPSGAGKSTLVNLLLRFWDFNEGQILLGGQDIRDYAQEDVRRCIGVVSQNAYLFSATVRDNLRIARPGASQAEIIEAAELANIHAFIESLPEGYETWVGEQGLRLSGGERQRLAIARTLLQDTPLLVLDEATANLDALTERDVLRSIFDLAKDRSLLLITHRLVGLEAMDEILVLDQGRVVERGRQEELLQAGGLYRRMWDLQNQVLQG
jgi:ATP-binding cassette subfamily C protein CydCD